MTAVRVGLPVHLRRLAGTGPEIIVDLGDAPPTIGTVLAAVESAHPVLVGAIRDSSTGKRRPFVRYFAAEQDFSHDPPTTPLPPAVASGSEPFLVVGAMAGG